VETVNVAVLPLSADPARSVLQSRRCCFSLFLFAAFVLFLAAGSSVAQEQHPSESEVKAAYLYNFGKFVRWQTDRGSNSDSLGLCILGKDPFGSVLDSTVEGDSIGGRKIVIKRIPKLQETDDCSILFVGMSEESRLAPILIAAQHSGVLTVSDIRDFAERGGIIGFVVQQGKIRFEVNRTAAEQSHLILSSELLKVARRVIGPDAPQP
jgi:YfiR/HmsC-like